MSLARRGRGCGDAGEIGLDELPGGVLDLAEANVVLDGVNQFDVADRVRASASPGRQPLRCPCRPSPTGQFTDVPVPTLFFQSALALERKSVQM